MTTKIKYSFTDPLGNTATQFDTFEGMEIDECVDCLLKLFPNDLVIILAEYI